MKTLLFLGIACVTFAAEAQTKVEKSIAVKPGQTVVLNLDYPEARLQTWDKSEVMITGTVSINKGEHDQAFQLDVTTTGNELVVTALLMDKESIPERIIIKKGDREYYFKTKNYRDPEIQKFLADNGSDYSYMSNGIIQEISLTIFIPKNTPTKVNAKHGLIEVSGFDGPLTIESKYGGVDATIQPQTAGQLTARTQYGEILTNLETKFNQTPVEGRGKRWTEISANLGKGPAYSLESKYGNVYLRKPK